MKTRDWALIIIELRLNEESNIRVFYLYMRKYVNDI
jgi:hypothetical protein